MKIQIELEEHELEALLNAVSEQKGETWRAFYFDRSEEDKHLDSGRKKLMQSLEAAKNMQKVLEK